ncbi:TolC family protein [Rapidithrix thailandica]|uniref:TolC family protein n=1 Tax=Rapidithrix thailandica TaxID=413964 RepID=A0AAW9S702_9BACT
MVLFRNTILVLLLTVAWQSASAQDVQQMSLQECIDYALSNHSDVQNAVLDTEVSKAQVGEVTAQGLPQINASASFTYNYKVPVAFLPASFMDSTAAEGEVAGVPMGTKYNGDAGVSLNQLIFDGAFFLGLKAAKTVRELSQKSLIQTKIERVSQVSKAYYTVLVTSERMQLAKQNLQRIDSLLHHTKAMYENGFREAIDVSRVRVSYNNAKSALNQAEKFLVLNKQILNFQMGRDVNEALVLTDKIEDIELPEQIFQDENFDYANRIEYSMLQTQQEVNRYSMKRYQVQYYPSLYLSASYSTFTGVNDMSKFTDKWYGQGAIGLKLNIPLFDGLQKKYLIQQQKLAMHKTENEQRHLQNAILMEKRQARVSMENALEELDNQQQNMDLAQEVYQVTKTKYEEGLGAILDVVDAETAYKEAETNYYNALYDALISKVDYEKAIGALYGE